MHHTPKNNQGILHTKLEFYTQNFKIISEEQNRAQEY